ncbi:hypothetical protein ACU4GH_01000 [Bradyrhizobium betae]
MPPSFGASPSRCRRTATSARRRRCATSDARPDGNRVAPAWSARQVTTPVSPRCCWNGGTYVGAPLSQTRDRCADGVGSCRAETNIARDQNYYPGASSGFGLGFAVRTSVPPGTSWPLGEYRWDGVGGTFFFIDPEDDLIGIFMGCRRRRSAAGFSWR